VPLLAGCFGGSDSAAIHGAAHVATPASTTAKSVAPSNGTCPLTLPNGRTPPGDPDIGANHGNDHIWTAMWPHNVVIARPHFVGADGSIGMKWPWWWRGVQGQIRIMGRRLDGDAPPLTAYKQKGYTRFQPSGIRFPTEGCWEVTGSVGEASLTFVTPVLKAARYWPLEEGGS
jgi:hypothetical protein